MKRKNTASTLHIYKFCYNHAILFHFIVLLLLARILCILTHFIKLLLMSLVVSRIYFWHLSKKLLVSNKQRLNVEFTYSIFLALSITVLVIWFYILLLVSGDIHSNPGPLSSLSDCYVSSSSGNGSIFGTSSLSSHL